MDSIEDDCVAELVQEPAAVMDAPAGPSAQAIEVIDDWRLDEIAGLADKAASFWVSIREAAIRQEPMTVSVHFRQARLVTYSVYLILQDFAREAGQ